MSECEYLCDDCSHNADCEIEELRTPEQGCMLFVKNGHTEAAPNVVLCDSCGKVDGCSQSELAPLMPGETCKWGYEEVVLVDAPEEDPTYTVAEVLNGFEDMIRRGLDDLADELRKHDLTVDRVEVDTEDHHEFVVGKAFPQVTSQVFSVEITVKTRRQT